MNKTFTTLVLLASLSLTACRSTQDTPQSKPDTKTEETQPDTPKEPEKPVEPEAQIVIEDGVLKSYPESKTTEEGTVTLDKTVTEIAPRAFAGNTKLKTLVAPGVKKIGAQAFEDASSLQLVDLTGYQPDKEHPYPETATDAFPGTPASKAIKLPANPSYTAWFEYIALHGFGAIDGLQSNLPANAVVKDGELISLPKGFRPKDAAGLLVLPETVTKIAESFLNQDQNDGRTGVKLIYGLGVTEIGNGAFSESYIQFAHFPQVKKLGMAVFGSLSGLKAINFPHLTEIGNLCFLPSSSPNKTSLYFVALPALEKVGRGSFSGTLAAVKTLILGTMPTIDKKPYNSKETDAIEGSWVPFFSGSKVSFEGGRAAGATLLVPKAALASYGIEAGASWEGFTIQLF